MKAIAYLCLKRPLVNLTCQILAGFVLSHVYFNAEAMLAEAMSAEAMSAEAVSNGNLDGLRLAAILNGNRSSINDIPPNESYLRTIGTTKGRPGLSLPHGSSFEDTIDIIDTKGATGIQERYDYYLRDYEMRKQYGLINSGSEKGYVDQMSLMSKDLLSEVQHQQTKKGEQTLKNLSDREKETLVAISPLVGAGAVVVALKNGRSFHIKLNENLAVTTSANVPAQTGHFSLASPWVEGSVDISAKVPGLVAPSSPDERYKFSLSRNLPWVNASSKFTYGSTTNSLNAALSRRITNNLLLEMDSSFPLDGGACSDLFAMRNGIVKLQYDFRF